MLYGTKDRVGDLANEFSGLSLLLALKNPEAQDIMELEEEMGDDAEEKFKDKFGGSSDKFSLHEALWQAQTLFKDIKGKVTCFFVDHSMKSGDG